MSAANMTCALCLIVATEIEAMTDFGFDEELVIGFLIQVNEQFDETNSCFSGIDFFFKFV